MLSPAVREQIRAASDIVEVIGGYLPLKRAGANFVALCPFHKEKSPSFNVNAHKQIFHCFGCHKGGDVFRFVQDYESIGFMDAVRRLAERAGIKLEFEQGGEQEAARDLKSKLLQIHDALATRWQQVLANEAAGQVARDYLAQRGVSSEAVKTFRLGAAPEAWDDTVNWSRSKDFPVELVEQAGLIIRKEETGRYYDRFRGRLMFPICDELGRVVGFSGRVLSGDEKTAKYVNSPETPIFRKSKVFFGLDKSKRAIGEAGFAIVCEGQLDLIACYMAGVQNMVAPQGTALTAEHTRILKRYTDEVVLCFDSDEAGQNAAVRSLDALLASGLAIRVAVVPAPHDPDSLIREQGVEAFRAVIGRAEGFFDFFLNRLCRLHAADTDKGRLAILAAMAEAVQKTANAVLIDTYAQKTALRLAVRPDAVRAEFKRAGGRPAPLEPGEEEYEVEAEPLAPPNALELGLVKLLFADEQLVRVAAANLNPAWLMHPTVRRVVQARLAADAHDAWQGVAAFMDELTDDAARQLVAEVAISGRAIPSPEQQLNDILLRLRNQALDQELAALTQRAAQPETPDSERLDLLRRQQQIHLLKRQPFAASAPTEPVFAEADPEAQPF
jgi:DNA primase